MGRGPLRLALDYFDGRLTVAEYARERVPAEAFDEVCKDCPGMAEKCREILLAAFTELDKVPRTDPFWQGTNNKPTLAKLGDWARRRLERSPHDVAAAWIAVAHGLVEGGRLPPPRAWQPLVGEAELEPDWLVRTGWNLHTLTGSATARELAVVLKELGLAVAAGPALARLATQGDPRAARWVDAVRAAL